MAPGTTRPLAQALGRIAVETRGEGLIDVTHLIAGWLARHHCHDGLLTLFLRHTSASLIIQENADPDVQKDLVTGMRWLAPENGPWVHTTEGPDDMPAHVRTMLTGVNLAVPVEAGAMMLGTWQGIYLFEHRRRPHRREIALHYLGTIDDRA